MTHTHKASLKFFTLACPDCASPLIHVDEDGVEYILSFRNHELAELEASDMAEDEGGKPGIIEVELKVVEAAEKKLSL